LAGEYFLLRAGEKGKGMKEKKEEVGEMVCEESESRNDGRKKGRGR